MGKRSDDGAAIDAAASHHDGKFEQNFIADLHVREKSAAVDLTTLANDSFALEMSVGTDHRVFADGYAFVDVGGVRVLERHSRQQPFFVNALAQILFHKSELLSGIDSHHLTAVLHLYGLDNFLLSETDGDDVRQIIFALSIVVFDGAQRREYEGSRGDERRR